MSNDVKALSISFRSDDGCIEHNNRDFFTDNVDKSRTPNNITYVKRDLRELYHELFDQALAAYNARQNRPDRQIPDYYEHIRKSKKEKLFQEIIVMFGNSENCGVGSENWETAVKLLDEYMREFEKRNPNLKVFNAVMHLLSVFRTALRCRCCHRNRRCYRHFRCCSLPRPFCVFPGSVPRLP